MNLSRGASFQVAVEKPSMATGHSVAVMDGIAHLGAEQGLVSKVMVGARRVQARDRRLGRRARVAVIGPVRVAQRVRSPLERSGR